MEQQEIFDSCLEGTIHDGKQVEEPGIHLTAGSVSSLVGRGQTDFGGDEQEPCEQSTISPTKRAPEDDYGWWELEGGEYRVRFNETITSGSGVFLVVPNDRILACGCVMVSVLAASGRIETVLSVPQQGVSIKENARIALLRRLGE